MVKVSIIVPVYNAEKYLERCVNSILKQTYSDFELLLIDDGSKDRSAEICDSFTADPRVHVIHKENTGVSDTRNTALHIAKGEYIQFLDADDWITPEATMSLVRAMETEGTDFVISDFYRVNGDVVARKGPIEKDGIMSMTAFSEQLLQRPSDFYFGVLWNKLFKRSLIEKYQIFMDPEIRWSEDFIFNLKYMKHCQQVYVLKVPLYYYVRTEGSLVTSVKIRDSLTIKQLVFQYYDDYCKTIFGEEEYSHKRMQVYRFLVDAARDGITLPLMPDNYKLGKERTAVSAVAFDSDGFIYDQYLQRKLQERLLEIVGLRNYMSYDEISLLYFLATLSAPCTFEEAVEILDTTYTRLVLSLRRLLSDKLIFSKQTDSEMILESLTNEDESNRKVPGTMREYTLTEDGEEIFSEILFVLNDLEQMQFDGFSLEEFELFHKLDQKRKKNIRKSLL